MQLTHRAGKVEHDLGHVRASLDVTAALQLEDIALGPEHRALREPLLDSLSCGHAAVPPAWAPRANRPGAKRLMSYTVPRETAS